MQTELSNTELEYLLDEKFLLTKRKIQEKLFKLLVEIEQDIKATSLETSFPFPKGTYLKSGKISKGENYKGLPYNILDYPRLFTKKSVFAYRCMFWWGNHFSTTLHIGGRSKETFGPKLLTNFEALKTQDIYICVNIDPWHYHFEKDNFKHVSQMDVSEFQKIIEERDFIKISNYMPLEEYRHAREFALQNLKRYFSYLLT